MARFSASCILLPFGLAFLLIGGAVFWFMLNEVRAIYDTQSWEEVLIDLQSAEVHFPDKPPPSDKHEIYELAVEYNYEYGGKQHTSTNYRRQHFSSNSYETMALTKRDLLASGDGLVAYVNPNDPSQAILEQESLWFGLILILPLLFMLIGATLTFVSLPIWDWLGSRSDRNHRTRFGDSVNDQKHNDRGGAR